jgi:hypothetical protein
MSTANTALSIVIGGAVGASFGQAITRTKNDLGGLQSKLAALAADEFSRGELRSPADAGRPTNGRTQFAPTSWVFMQHVTLRG